MSVTMPVDHGAATEWAAQYTRHTNPWGNLARAYLALLPYARHTDDCELVAYSDVWLAKNNGGKCTCGLAPAKGETV